MLTKSGCETRQRRLWAAVPESVDWLLVADPRHVNYLSGFLVQPLSFSHGERALLLLEREHGVTLLGDNFTIRSAAADYFVDHEEVTAWYDHKHAVINRDHALQQALSQVANRLLGRVGVVEAEWLPLGAWETLAADHETHSTSQEFDDLKTRTKSVDLGTLLRALRRQKEPDELALMQTCMRAGKAGHEAARAAVRPGVTELEVYLEVQRAALAEAGRAGIIYGDFRAATLTAPKQGGLPTEYALQAGDLYVLDYSVMLSAYRSDFTNTYAVGEPSPAQMELFAVCQAALQAGEATLKAGVSAADVHRAVKQPFLDAGKGDAFTHHAGHGLGMAHPEPPILVPESTDVLQAGDVVTLEPGGYIAGVGGMRIEHNYLITETGYERLSDHEISLT